MIVDTNRQAWIDRAETIIIKVGTNVLADAHGQLNRARIHNLAEQIHRLRKKNQKVVLVSSGAIGAGVGQLGLGKRPTELPQLQACAAVGQTSLMQCYQEALAPHGIIPAQVLLTASDLDHRLRYLNVRNTLHTLFEYDCLPVINENDTVSVAEIKFGDNDHLAALVANLLMAQLLVLLTNVDGLFTGDPRVDADAQLVSVVPAITESVTGMASLTKSLLGTGGMRSKLKAVRLATMAGCAVIMANGSKSDILDQVFSSQDVGTLFLPHTETMPAWKRWLGYSARPKGVLQIDAGAVRAVREKGRSLLPVGVLSVTGEFHKGDVLSIVGPDQEEIGRGLSNFNTADARLIAGRKTEQLAEVLGQVRYIEIIHRDNFTTTG